MTGGPPSAVQPGPARSGWFGEAWGETRGAAPAPRRAPKPESHLSRARCLLLVVLGPGVGARQGLAWCGPQGKHHLSLPHPPAWTQQPTSSPPWGPASSARLLPSLHELTFLLGDGGGATGPQWPPSVLQFGTQHTARPSPEDSSVTDTPFLAPSHDRDWPTKLGYNN